MIQRTMSREELRLYLMAWMDSRAEAERWASQPPSPVVDENYKRAKANEEYDRANYLRLRAQYQAQNRHALDQPT